MKTLLKPLIITLGIATLAPAIAQAQPSPDEKNGSCGRMEAPEHRGHPEAGMMPGLPMPPFLHGIELTEAQRDAIFSILHAEAPAVRERMKAVHKAHEALHALTMSGKYDEARAKELAETAADNMAVLSLLRSRSESRIYALLTPEQRKAVNETKNKFGPHPGNARSDASRTASRQT
jgi:protein CpxP